MNFKNLIPTTFKAPLRAARDAALDGVDLLRKHDADHPPRPLQRLVGDGDFKAVGEGLLRELQVHTSLKPDDAVLDVGCGIGRVAAPLTRYLNSKALYEGFDIMPKAIKWCQKHITPQYPNFRFQLADIHSVYYNPQGRLKASDFVFPFPDASFDVVFLASIFTHLLPDDMEHYLREIVRVLKPEGRVLFTVFLLNETSLRAIDKETAVFNPTFEVPRGRIVDPAFPEAVVAHDETAVREICERLGLQIEVIYGGWSREIESEKAHDYVIALK